MPLPNTLPAIQTYCCTRWRRLRKAGPGHGSCGSLGSPWGRKFADEVEGSRNCGGYDGRSSSQIWGDNETEPLLEWQRCQGNRKLSDRLLERSINTGIGKLCELCSESDKGIAHISDSPTTECFSCFIPRGIRAETLTISPAWSIGRSAPGL